jgi:hypothetical protein
VATIQYVVNAVDAASATFTRIAASADTLNGQLDELAHKSATARVGLAGDKEAKLALDSLDLKLARLGKRIARPDVTVEGLAAAQLGITRLDLALDRLNAKHARPKVNWLRSLFGGAGGGGGAAVGQGAQAAGGLFGGGMGALGPYGQAIGYGALGAAAAVFAPALLPLLFGLGIGGAGAAGGLAAGSKASAQLQALQKQFRGITGTTPASAAARARVQAQIKAFRAEDQPQLAFGAAAGGLTTTLKDTFFGALTQRPFLQATGTGGGAFGQSFLQGLTGILHQLERFTKSIGPSLGAAFRASLPFLQLFVKVLERMAKILLPAVTQSLNELVSSGALKYLLQGFTAIVQGIAHMIEAIGPRGMRDSAKLFMNFCKVMGAAATVLGKVINGLSVTVFYAAHAIHQQWDELRHHTAGAFDRIRHDVADFGHNIAVWFDRIRHYVAASWDATWQDTVGRVIRGVRDVLAVFRRLPTGIRTILGGLGHMLASIATAAMGQFLSGLKSAGGVIIGWLKSFASSVVNKIKSFFGIASPSSVFFHIGRNLMDGLINGLKSRVTAARAAARGAAGAIDTGARSGSAAVAQAYARSILPRGWSWPALVALWNQESGWNSYAVNPTSGAYGIPQSLGHGHPYNLGDYKAQIIWGLNYISGRYGSSQAAWAHEIANNWYDRGGWLPPGASLAVNTTGRPERVTTATSDQAMLASLYRIEGLLRDGPYQTAAGVGDAVSGASRQAAKSARYSSRPR